MLYYRALQQGLAKMPDSDPALRAQLEAERELRGLSALHAELAAIDPESAARIHPNDPQRILRALEVYRATGRSLTEHHRAAEAQRAPYHFLNYCVCPPDRAVLHQRIAQRFEQMLEMGFIEEVEKLRRDPRLDLSSASMRCVGYRQVWQYLDGEFDRKAMLEKGIAATRQLAKRQLTWLRGWDELEWIDPLAILADELIAKIQQILSLDE
jgi:tRNA dimethylallyltransferase